MTTTYIGKRVKLNNQTKSEKETKKLKSKRNKKRLMLEAGATLLWKEKKRKK